MAKFKVGDRVKIIDIGGGTNNPLGSVGIISYIDEYNTDCRVIVPGFTDDNLINWSSFVNLKLVEEE